MDLNAFMTDKTSPKSKPKQETLPEQNPQTEPVSSADAFAELPDGRIPQGQRNTTLSRLAGKLIKRYGNTQEAWEKFLEKAKACDPPLDERELKTIWGSAVKFGRRTFVVGENYLSPEEYNNPTPRKPEDYTDVGQAYVFAKYCRSTSRSRRFCFVN